MGGWRPQRTVMTRQVVHIDCDCFFASVEMRDNPVLSSVPIAIGGSPDGRGVIATCNYPARAFGVHSAMATAKALKLCPDLHLLHGNMEKYRLASGQIMSRLEEYGVRFEQVSIDEAYLELDQEQAQGAMELVEMIRARIFREVGVRVSAGIAPNRFLAKVASDWRKPNGQFQIRDEEVERFVRELPVKAIPGVGPKMTDSLHQAGVHLCGDLQDWSLARLIRAYGKMGVLLYQRCRGEDDREIGKVRQRKSLSVEKTFRSDIASEQECLQQLPDLWERWQSRLAQTGCRDGNLVPFVKFKFADFTQTTLTDSHRGATYQGFETLIREARTRSNKDIRLIGIGARLNDRHPGQGELFG